MKAQNAKEEVIVYVEALLTTCTLCIVCVLCMYVLYVKFKLAFRVSIRLRVFGCIYHIT